jgi:hypothetical protein
MTRILSLLLVLLSLNAYSQSTISIKGTVTDKVTDKPLESATIYLSTVKDSTMIDYTISDRNGKFELTTKKITQPVYLVVSFMGFADYKQEISEITTNRDFGILAMEEAFDVLGEVVIVSEAPPVRIKQDTLEFNASSFKVRPDANVEALLKQLPGVQVDSNGKITVNGKEVNNILVNGKPFFGKDGKVATQNLPSDIIDKVQISDTKTKEEELAGQAASSENKTINLTIQKDKNKGLFGKFNAGAGTDDRYEASGLINYFKDQRKLSFLGSSNNINSIGFSMDEVFDSMGGGRSFYSRGDGSFVIDGQEYGGGSGITTSNMIGLNYSDEFIKKIEPSASYFYSSSENHNDSRSRELNLQNNSIETSESTSRRISNAHNLNGEIEVKVDSLTTISLRPSLKQSNNHFTGRSVQRSVSEEGILQNDSESFNNSISDNNTFGNNFYFFRKTKKKDRSYSFYFNNSNSSNISEQQTISTTNLYLDNLTIGRNQIQIDKDISDTYDATATYTEPLTDSLNVSVGTKFGWASRVYNKKTFDFDNMTNDYSELNGILSNYIESNTNTISPFVNFNLRKKKLNARLGFSPEFVSFKNLSHYLGNATDLNKDYFFPKISSFVSYRMSKSKSVYANYGYQVNLPSASQMIPVENLSNPLNTIVGNPDLDPTRTHRIYLGYNNYDFPTRSGFYLYSGASLMNNRVVASTTYDENARRTTTFENVDNTYNGYGGVSWDKTIKREQHTFRSSIGFNMNFSLDKGLANSALYEARGLSFSPEVEFSYEYGELLTITPSYTYQVNRTNYRNYAIDQSSNFVHVVKLQTTSYWPKHFVFGNDIGYTYNSDIADGFKKDFYLWNTSLGYNFAKDKFLAKVKVYDVLNQNINATRTISETAIRDVENTVLRRYVMFSLTYKIEKFGGKPENTRRWRH